MSDQEFVNRSHGQKIRRIRETQEVVIDVVANHEDRLAQSERDIKVLKARVTDVEGIRTK